MMWLLGSSDVSDCMLKLMLVLCLLVIWMIILVLCGMMIGWFESECGVMGISIRFESVGCRIGLLVDSVYVVELVGVEMIKLFECWLYMKKLLIDMVSFIMFEVFEWLIIMLLKVRVEKMILLLCMICVCSSVCVLVL